MRKIFYLLCVCRPTSTCVFDFDLRCAEPVGLYVHVDMPLGLACAPSMCQTLCTAPGNKQLYIS